MYLDDILRNNYWKGGSVLDWWRFVLSKFYFFLVSEVHGKRHGFSKLRSTATNWGVPQLWEPLPRSSLSETNEVTRVWLVPSLTLSQCTLAGPVYTGMLLECHWLTQCTLEYHWAIQRICAGYTGTPLEKLSWKSPTLECHWRNLIESSPHWEATGESLTFAAYTGTPLEGLWQPTHAPTHIVKHAE